MKNVNININGEELEVLSLLPEITNEELALVNLSVLKRLTAFLPKASYESIKNRFMIDVNKTESIEELVALMESELAFQKTVNVLTIISQDPDFASESSVVGKIDLND